MLFHNALCFIVLLAISVSVQTLNTDHSASRFYVKKDRPPGGENRRSIDTTAVPSARRESNFDPDVLNRFLEEYASKIKRTTELPVNFGFDEDSRVPQDSQNLEAVAIETNDKDENATTLLGLRDTSKLNDTVKRHKFYGGSSSAEDRNSGWVTLDAIPWSKSKISKWQANPTTQGSWPVDKPWDKPGLGKPWNSDFPTRPASYESNKPWQNKLTKPHWSDNAAAGSSKPWYTDRPRPGHHDRPSYTAIDKYEDNPNQAQKWPPERPSWDRYGDSGRPSSDIITDNAPPNFPTSNWDRPGQRPSYTHHLESYVNEPGGWHDRNDFPNNNGKYRPNDDGFYDRPHFSQYQYPPTPISSGSLGANYPPSHPSSGDGQWVLLSTNRGYSKSRQRSIKLDALVNTETRPGGEKLPKRRPSHADEEEHVPAMTSKRQIRLTVLPSINGTNTTTSHGGLLEVERTFKTVDQSQKEYEQEHNNNSSKPLGTRIVVNKRPMRNSLAGVGGKPSNTAVLAAVGAGMLPATMAMMIPMMLGRRRRKRSTEDEPPKFDDLLQSLPQIQALLRPSPRKRM